MNIKNIENIVNGIVENEFNHVQDTTEEQQRLIRELEDSISAEWLKLCIFYFREGLRAGLSNLKFLKEIEHIDYYL